MWRGAIQFGLVTIPLRLYLATESKGISFHTLHAECLSRIQMQTWCPVHERTITRAGTVKGYELAPGQYVVITDEDLAADIAPSQACRVSLRRREGSLLHRLSHVTHECTASPRQDDHRFV
jgi:non-homologous end joining protein Ku